MITNPRIKNLIRNGNILTNNLKKFGYQNFYDGKDLITYLPPKRVQDFITNEMKIEKDNNDIYFCWQNLCNGEIEIFYHDEHFTTKEMNEKQRQIYNQIFNN